MHYVLYNTLSANKQGLEYSRLLLGKGYILAHRGQLLAIGQGEFHQLGVGCLLNLQAVVGGVVVDDERVVSRQMHIALRAVATHLGCRTERCKRVLRMARILPRTTMGDDFVLIKVRRCRAGYAH